MDYKTKAKQIIEESVEHVVPDTKLVNNSRLYFSAMDKISFAHDLDLINYMEKENYRKRLNVNYGQAYFNNPGSR